MFSFKSFLNSLKDKKEIKEKIKVFESYRSFFHSDDQIDLRILKHVFVHPLDYNVESILDFHFPKEWRQKVREKHDELHGANGRFLTSTEVQNQSQYNKMKDFRFDISKATVEDANGHIYTALYISTSYYQHYRENTRRHRPTGLHMTSTLLICTRMMGAMMLGDVSKQEWFNLNEIRLLQSIDTYVDSDTKDVYLVF